MNLTSFFGKTFSLEKGLISLYLRLKMWQYNATQQYIVYDDVEHHTKGLHNIIKILNLDIGIFSMKIEVRMKYLD